MVAAAAMLLLMASDGRLSRWEGAVLAASAVGHTLLTIRSTRTESPVVREEFEHEFPPEDDRRLTTLARHVALLVVGIAVVVLGADLLVNSAIDLAGQLGVSDALIGLTIVAIGTSAPELVTMIVATMHRDRDIALGNILGSSTYNILAILGITVLVPSDGVEVDRQLVVLDLPVMLAATLVCIPVFMSGRAITRIEGLVFVAAYIAYLVTLVLVHG